MKSWVRRARNVILIIACIPIVLIFLYRLPFVQPISTLMLADIVMLQSYDRRWTSFEDMGKNGPAAVIMSEDGQFCRHYGVDWREMKAVVAQALDGGNVRGASTITMQTAKNLFLWNGRQMIRKLMELPLAVLLDFILPKQRILEIYLNIAEWGPGIYGIEAAAQHYFKKPAKDLTPRQAALLAVTLPNPAARNPAKPSKALNSLANIIERRARGAQSHIQCIQPGN